MREPQLVVKAELLHLAGVGCREQLEGLIVWLLWSNFFQFSSGAVSLSLSITTSLGNNKELFIISFHPFACIIISKLYLIAAVLCGQHSTMFSVASLNTYKF